MQTIDIEESPSTMRRLCDVARAIRHLELLLDTLPPHERAYLATVICCVRIAQEG